MSNSDISDSGLQKLGRAVIDIEAREVANLAARVDDAFVRACRLMLACHGRIVVLGMGKSGHIGGKLAATLASTGTPAFFVHPGEASHGDLGMITAQDVVLAISNSGETQEILTILPLIKRLHVPLIALTGNGQSTLARNADAHVNIAVSQEACPLGLAPTSSTTATLVMGDALAIALLDARGFTREDFALSHPGGSLGRRLLLHVRDVMHSGERVPRVETRAPVSEALLEMSRKGLGMTAVVESGNLRGIFTDGDLRRLFQNKAIDLHNQTAGEVMTANCKTARPQMLAAECLELMDRHKINGLLVVDDDNTLVGALNMHDLLRAGVV